MSAALIERCKGRWHDVLVAVGVPASALTGKHASCPACGGKDRFRFDDKEGSGSWYCNGCPRRSGYGIHLPQQVFGWNYAETCAAIEAVLVGAEPNVDRVPHSTPAEMSRMGDKSLPKALAAAKAIWESAQRINDRNGTGVYLARRGLQNVADALWLRHGDRVLYLDEDGEFCGRFPAMLAAVRAPSGNIFGLHRTFLTPDGRKADVPTPRKLLGTLPDGAAVRLADHGGELGIAEGIETALSATALTGIPCWAAINANGLAKWLPPEGVRSVVIFGDHDAKFAGQQAAFTLAHRLACRGLAVRVEIPSSVGDDWNDVLMKGASA
jgi:putative DNA primase/helicase